MTRMYPRLVAAAAVLGVVYALSPVAAWFAAAMACLLWRAQRNLQGRERVWMLGLLGAALAVRLAAIALLIFAIAPGTYTYPSFFGDGRYAIGRSLWMRGAALGETMHPRMFFEAFEPYGAGGYNYVLAALQVALGPATWALHLLAIAFFLSGAVVWHRIIRRTFGASPALLVFAVLLFAPTWLAWSVSPIKESFQFLTIAVCVATVLRAIEATRARDRVMAAIACAAAVGVLATLRAGGVVIIAGSLVAGVACAMVTRSRTAALSLVATAIVVVAAAASLPVARARLMIEINGAANRHMGHVRTPGTFYKLLDERFYHEPPGTIVDVALTPAEATRFLIRSVAAFVLVPLPWQAQGRTAPLIVPTQMLWYVLVALAVVGTAAAMRSSAVFTVMVISYIALSVAVIAPNSGNVGTLTRHRDMLLPFVTSLSAVGAYVLSARFARPHRPLVEAHA